MPDQNREKGERAEEVAEWYFRLNGFFLIPGFVVHPDVSNRNPRTEADLLGIRLSGSCEGVQSSAAYGQPRRSGHFRAMRDDERLIISSKDGTVIKHLIAMVEVKSRECDINGPWSRKEDGNMHRALSRVGLAISMKWLKRPTKCMRIYVTLAKNLLFSTLLWEVLGLDCCKKLIPS